MAQSTERPTIGQATGILDTIRINRKECYTERNVTMKHKASKRVFAAILVITMLLTAFPLSAIAETNEKAYARMVQTIGAVIYTDESYTAVSDEEATVTVTGLLPEDTTAKAYAVTVDDEKVCAAFDITLFDKNGGEFEPDSVVTVEIATPELEEAITNGDELTVHHITENDVTEEIAVSEQSGGSVSFTAESFSIYYIKDGTAGDPVTYRRTYKFYNLMASSDIGATSKNSYEPYFFSVERGGRTMQTNEQILIDGDALIVPQLPYHGTSTTDVFAGWYIGDENGVAADAQKAEFGTALNDIQSSGSDSTVYLYAKYGVEKYLTFYYEATAQNESDDMVFYTYPVVVPANGEFSFDLYDYSKQVTTTENQYSDTYEDLRYIKAPVPSNKNVFLGWTTSRADASLSAQNPNAEGETTTTPAIRSNRATNVSVTQTENKITVNGSQKTTDKLDFYPIFDRANWVNFDGGSRDNGAKYQAPVYILTTESWDTLPYITRKGYTFEGWYYDPEYDTATENVENVSAEYAPSDSAVKLTVGERGLAQSYVDTKTVPISDDAVTKDGVYTITSTASGNSFCPNKKITLHALWKESTTTFSIVFWAQQNDVDNPDRNGADADRSWDSSDLDNYDWIWIEPISTVLDNGVRKDVTTGMELTVDMIDEYMDDLAAHANVDHDFDEYADPTKFYYGEYYDFASSKYSITARDKTEESLKIRDDNGSVISGAGNIKVAAAGTTVVNVFYDRLRYKFEYYEYQKNANNGNMYYYPGGYTTYSNGTLSNYYRRDHYRKGTAPVTSAADESYVTYYNEFDAFEDATGNKFPMSFTGSDGNTYNYYGSANSVKIGQNNYIIPYYRCSSSSTNYYFRGSFVSGVSATALYTLSYGNGWSAGSTDSGIELVNTDEPFIYQQRYKIKYFNYTKLVHTIYEVYGKDISGYSNEDTGALFWPSWTYNGDTTTIWNEGGPTPSGSTTDNVIMRSAWFTMRNRDMIYLALEPYDTAYYYTNYYFQNINKSYPALGKGEMELESYVGNTRNWSYSASRMVNKNGFEPVAVIGSTTSGGSRNAGYVAPGHEDISTLPSSYTSRAYNGEVLSYTGSQSFTQKDGTQVERTNQLMWDMYYSRNSYTLRVRDADDINLEYINTKMMFEEEPREYMTGYSELNNDYFKTLFSGKPVVVNAKDPEKLYVFAGVYRDPSCQDLVYSAEDMKYVDGCGFEKMPDHDITLFIKWKPAEFLIQIIPDGGVLTKTESAYYWVDEGEKLQEYQDVERPYIEANDGQYYYMYSSYDALADKNKTGASSKERYARYLTLDEYNNGETYKNIYELDENGSYVKKGTYSSLDDNPKVYPGTGSTQMYKPDPRDQLDSLGNSRPTYQLIGWFEKLSDGSLTLYNFDRRVSSDTTLQAMWRSGLKFRIEYDANEYEDDGSTVKYYGKVENADTKFDSNLAGTTVLNYGEGARAVVKYAAKASEENSRAQFVYWTIKGDASNTRYDLNDTFTISSDMVNKEIKNENGETIRVITLQAHYSSIESVGIKYNANGAEGGDENGDSLFGTEYYKENGTVVLHSATRDNFTNSSGKILAGWSTQPNSSVVEYELNGTYGINDLNSDDGVITLYAVWKDPITVTYNLNGGSYTTTPPSLTKDDDETYTASAYPGGTAPTPTAPKKDGYTFQYWTTVPDPEAGSDPVRYDFGELTGDTTLYAYYTENSADAINVRYFIMNDDGSMVDITNDESYWYVNNNNYNFINYRVDSIDVGNTETDIAYATRYTPNGSVYGPAYLLKTAYDDDHSAIAIGVGSKDTNTTTVRAVKVFDKSNNDYADYGPTSGGSYLKYEGSDLMWSATNDDSAVWERYDPSDTAVYVIFMNYGDTAYTFKDITVTNTVTGDTTDASYDPDTKFDYTVSYTNNGTNASTMYTSSEDHFTLKDGETRTVSVLTTKDGTSSQTVTVSQPTTPTGYTLTSVTGGDSTTATSVTASASTTGTEAEFTNNYKVTSTPVTSDEKITISADTFISLGDDRPTDVPLLNGDKLDGNKVTVNVSVINSSGEVIDTLVIPAGDPSSLTLFTDQLEKYKGGDYKLKVELDVTNPEDDTVSLGSSFIQSNETGEPYEVIPPSGTITDKNSIEWTKLDNNNYTCSIDDLFDDTTGELKTDTLSFNSQVRTERIKIEFRYYDRDLSSASDNKPANISSKATGIKLMGTMSTASSDLNKVGSAISDALPDAASKINNVLDEYYFHTLQSEYVTMLTEEDTALRYKTDSKYYSDYYDDPVNVLHTDCYGRVPVSGSDLYMSEYSKHSSDADFREADLSEKWVNYHNENADGYNETSNRAEAQLSSDTVSDNVYTVTKVVVWAFNTPKLYTLKAVVPTSETQLVQAASDDSLFVADETKIGTPILGQYYYNQRVGGASKAEKYREEQDDISTHMDNYGKKYPGVVTNNGGSLDITAPETISDYYFDGWYINTDQGYVKVSADPEYSDRITADIKIFAGYKKTEYNRVPAVSVTQNAIEKYIDCLDAEKYTDDNGVERYRYVTVVNGYGFEDYYENFKDIAVMYVVVPSDKEASDITAVDMSEFLAQNNENGALESILNAQTKGIAATQSVTLKDEDTNTYVIDDQRRMICYVYSLDSDITLTNKNRTQFTLDVKAADTADGQKFSNIIVLAGVSYDDGGTTKWVFSDNYVMYIDGTAYSLSQING